MELLRVGMVGFDITPRFHPTFGAWGSTPSMREVDMPLRAGVVALEQDDRRVLWDGLDLVGDPPRETDGVRDRIASALGLTRRQVIWSTSQTHSSGAVPGSKLTGSSVCDLTKQDPEFMAAEQDRFFKSCIDAGREAIERLEPVTVWAGRGYCDSMSYNTRFPMPTGGVKFSRHHAEGLQSGKYFDPTVGLIRFENGGGKPIGVIFNFCAHPATMINDTMISPDYVGTARQYIEEATGGAPAMFCQGFCGDVNCYHMFLKPQQAKRSGARLGRAAVEALKTLTPVRGTPFDLEYETIELPCQPMPTMEKFEAELAFREEFFKELQDDPFLTWCGGINLPEHFSPKDRGRTIELQIDYLQKGIQMLQTGRTARTSLPITLGVIRMGDAAAVLSPGENFTLTARAIRDRSCFAHTLVCGDTNGLFGYIGNDEEIDRGGYETDSFWKMTYIDGFRLPLAKGSSDRIIHTATELLQRVNRIT